MRGYVIQSNRIEKANKIITILEESLRKPIKDLTILDIGTGNGEIANYIAGKNNHVYSVDVQKLVDDKKCSFQFIQVKDERLPFADNFFDIVISNHVIEHLEKGMRHLNEINRVVKPRGGCYFATPNRNFPWEVHTRTLLIHYFPYQAFWRILKHLHRYQEPIYLMQYGEMKKAFLQAGFTYEDFTMKVINYPERYHMGTSCKIEFPAFLAKFSPTNIFFLKKL